MYNQIMIKVLIGKLVLYTTSVDLIEGLVNKVKELGNLTDDKVVIEEQWITISGLTTVETARDLAQRLTTTLYEDKWHHAQKVEHYEANWYAKTI